jgi:membrane protein
MMPSEAASTFDWQINYVIRVTRPGLLSLSVIGALFVATGATNALIKAMNRAYGVEETRPFWRRYLTALGLTAAAGLAVLGAFLMWAGGWGIGSQVAATLGLQRGFYRLVEVVYWPFVGLLVTIAVALLYCVAPNIRLRFRWVIPGALVFAMSWLGSTAGFALYVEQLGSYRMTYGTLAGVVALLLWSYLTGLLLVLGVELNSLLNEHLDAAGVEAQRRLTLARAAVRQLPPRSGGTYAKDRGSAPVGREEHGQTARVRSRR